MEKIQHSAIEIPSVKILIEEVRASPMSKVIRIGTMDSKVALFLTEEDFTLFQELRDFSESNGSVEEAIMGYLDRPGSDAVVRMVFNQPGEAIIKYDITERPTGTRLGAKSGRKYAAKVRFRHLLELLRLGFFLVLETGTDSNVRYVSIYAGFEHLSFEAERIKMRFPLSKATIERYIPCFTESIKLNQRPAATFWTEPADMRSLPEPATDKRSAIFKLDLIADFKGGDYNTIGLEKVKEHFFSPSQRNLLFYSIMSRCKVTIEGHFLKKLSVKQLIHYQYYQDVYTPHTGLVEFTNNSSFFANDLRAKLTRWSRKISSEPVPLMNIRAYFGERVGFFFAWLDFYTTWFQSAMYLGFLALGWGAWAWVHQVNLGTGPNTLGYLGWINLIDNEATPVFALLISIWSLVYIKFWKRRAAYLSFIWDMDDYSSTIETIRIEWAPSSVRNSKVSSGTESFVPAKTRRSKRLIGKLLMIFGFLTLLVFVSLNVFASAQIVAINNALSSIQNAAVQNFALTYAKSALSGLFTVAQIFILIPIYWYFILWMNDYENYRLGTNYQNALIWKLFLLNFVNSYGLVFFSGMVQPTWSILIGGGSSTTNGTSILVFGEPVVCTTALGYPTCLVSLVTYIAIVFVATQFAQQVYAFVYPMLTAGSARKSVQYSDSRKHVPIFMTESEFLTMTPELFQNEYTAKVTMLGYVLLFSAPFPIAPFLSFMNNVVEIRANLYKRVVYYKRNFAEGANSIGSWDEIIQLLVYFGILTNGFFIAFTGNGPEIVLKTYYPSALPTYQNNTTFYRLLIVFVYEHFVFILSYILDITIPDVPAAVRVGRIAEQFIRSEREISEVLAEDDVIMYDKLFYDAAEVNEDDDEGNGAPQPSRPPQQEIILV